MAFSVSYCSLSSFFRCSMNVMKMFHCVPWRINSHCHYTLSLLRMLFLIMLFFFINDIVIVCELSISSRNHIDYNFWNFSPFLNNFRKSLLQTPIQSNIRYYQGDCSSQIYQLGWYWKWCNESFLNLSLAVKWLDAANLSIFFIIKWRISILTAPRLNLLIKLVLVPLS